jgi:hypothetical protein
MPHDASDGVFVIGQHGTAIRTGGVGAVVAGSSDGLQVGLLACAHQQAHVPPAFAVIEAIERMTGRHACLAAGAGIQIDLKAILLAGIRLAEWNEVREALTHGAGIIFLGEKRDGCLQCLLLTERRVDEADGGTASRDRALQIADHGLQAEGLLELSDGVAIAEGMEAFLRRALAQVAFEHGRERAAE